jgi:hypothetical protein
MQNRTDWDLLAQTGLSFSDSRWPYIGDAILALLPRLKAEPAFENAWIYTSLGTVIIEFPPEVAPRFHVEPQASGQFIIYWYGANPLDFDNDVKSVVELEEVIPMLLRHIKR